ncbi:hypothetical protein [Bosea sp. NBC_00550]|uniref:hypothetical protein n=1 Tax=Bosea sp. NBC_00550 TaxID=2969621 RepID=UPI00222F0FDF|nr:hypothetical protein [Bosea sp. NBC_00550]UZF92951.1 hypothetical protein NWE53_01655 [Bosea sp. NBC_00550]
MIDRINQTHTKAVSLSFDNEDHCMPKFIYVAPLLSEVDRITDMCPRLNFRNPQSIDGRKLCHLDSLIDRGENICTTHSLFKLLTKDMCAKIKEQGYTLVIDETLECVALFDELSASDRALLLDKGMIYVDKESRRIRWNNDDHKKYVGKFDHIKRLCDNGNLVFVRDKVLIWEFPSEFIRAFEDVLILTYLFPGSAMASYLQAEGLEYELKTLGNRKVVPYADNDEEVCLKQRLRQLITIYEGPLNDCGQRVGKSNPFSSTWLKDRTDKQLQSIKATIEYFFKSVTKTPAVDNAWTTFGVVKGTLKGARYSRGFIPCNAKATNEYREKKALAYLCNIFPHPYVAAYFQDRGIAMDEDAYALSEMVQWIWRSQIREGEPIIVFIPSGRMRGLLKDWLGDKPVTAEEAETITARAA